MFARYNQIENSFHFPFSNNKATPQGPSSQRDSRKTRGVSCERTESSLKMSGPIIVLSKLITVIYYIFFFSFQYSDNHFA